MGLAWSTRSTRRVTNASCTALEVILTTEHTQRVPLYFGNTSCMERPTEAERRATERYFRLPLQAMKPSCTTSEAVAMARRHMRRIWLRSTARCTERREAAVLTREE